MTARTSTAKAEDKNQAEDKTAAKDDSKTAQKRETYETRSGKVKDVETHETAAKDDSKTAQTTAQKREADEDRSGEVKDVETDEDAAGKGDTRGAVAYGDTGFEDEDALAPDDDSLGTVRVGDKEVPWTYLNADHFEDEAKVRTSDSDDPARSWTNQEVEGEGDDEVPVALIPVQAEPGQTFRATELPNVDSLKNAGIDPVQFLSGLPVRADVEDEAKVPDTQGSFG